MFDWCAKKSKKMYKSIGSGNTIIRKEIRQHFSTYLIHIKKSFLFIDTRFFTASTDILCTKEHYHRNRKNIDVKAQLISSIPEFKTAAK